MRKLAVLGLFALTIIATSVGVIFAQDEDTDTEATASAWLGVRIAETEEGVTVIEVVPGSPANAADVLLGDVITAFNGTAIDSAQALSEAVQAAAPGDNITLTVIRNGEEMSIEATLIAVPMIGGRGFGAEGFMLPGLEGQFRDRDGRGFGNGREFEFGPRGFGPGEFMIPGEGAMFVQAILGAQLEEVENGYEVVRVMPRAVFELEVGDIVTQVNGESILDVDWMALLTGAMGEDDPALTLTVLREGEEITLESDDFFFGGRGFHFGMPGDDDAGSTDEADDADASNTAASA